MAPETHPEFERMRNSILAALAPPAPPRDGYASTPDSETLALHYEHVNSRLGIHFQVHKLPFEHLQALDVRLLTIAPGASSEKHRHAHESIFFVLQGQALIVIEGEEIAVAQGGLATVPRWAVHQTCNGSRDHEVRLLAVTDFGLTSALLGNYDRQTRLKSSGKQAFE